MRPWFRRNRWGLIVLPLALVLAVAATSYRVRDYWWDALDANRVATASGAQAHWLTYTESFTDSTGKQRRRVRFRVFSVTRRTVVPQRFGGPVRITDSAFDVYRVRLDFEADPSTVLSGCQLALTDTHGDRFVYADTIDNVEQDLYPCVPDDHPGPSIGVVGEKTHKVEPGAERPRTWTTQPYVFVPKGTTITGLRLWWEGPYYAKVSVRPSA